MNAPAPADLPVEQTLRFILGVTLARDARILEVGCGRGALAAKLKARGFDVTAIDRDLEAVRVTRERGVRVVAAGSIPRGSSALTITSVGSSGGATRDLGVFSRGDTVYTVYIPMADAGGGPDWPIEYALMNSALAGNGLLTPPVALKKIHTPSRP